MTTLVIFDIDGTLLRSARLHQESFLTALETCDFGVIDSDFDSYAHHTDSWTFGEVFRANYGRRPTRTELDTFDATLHDIFRTRLYAGGVEEIVGATEFLATLAEDGSCATAFATGGLRRVTREKMRLVDPDVGDALVATASEHTYREHIVLHAVALAQAYYGRETFDRIISIGDGPWDAKTARALACEFVGIGPSAEHFRGLCPDENRIPAFEHIDLRSSYSFLDGAAPTSSAQVPPMAECECWEGWSLSDGR